MAECWIPVELILPSSLSGGEVLDRVYSQVRLNASEAGKFVAQVRVGAGEMHSDGWCRWPAAYLPGPPAPPPVPEHTDAAPRPEI